MVKKIILVFIFPLYAFAANVEVAFSPGQTSLNLVLKTITSARKSICMATYSFTQPDVAKALVNAKNRGIAVMVVSDYDANKNKYTATRYLANNGVSVRLNNHYAIMHNKFIVVDNQTVETGSFNYSQAAVRKNAENVIVFWDNPDIASQYSNECNRLFNEAFPLAN